VKGSAQKALGRLPISSTTRATILEGMQRVTSTPAGTAFYAFQGERTPIAAKTGSAENENPEAHAWFIGFATPDQPRVLVLAMVEGGEHGGTVAAPVARQIIDYAVAHQ
jgi:cell division protein FtsI/penicillin-binding protein 2